MLYQIVVSNMRRDGINVFNVEDELDLLLCPPETAVAKAIEELALAGLRFEIADNDVPAVGQRQIEAHLFLGGENFPPTPVSVEVFSPKSSDRPQKWSFIGPQRKKVLIVCSGNSCRSQMAEGFLKKRFSETIEVYSAGLTPSERVNPNAVAVMSDVGIDISDHRPKPIQSFKGQNFDYIISVCDVNAAHMPYVSKSAVALNYGIVDPVAYEGILPKSELLIEFQTAREEIFDVLEQFATHISSQLSFVTSRAERKRAAQRIFKPMRDRQKITQSQLNMVISNDKNGLLIEGNESDIKLALIEHIEEPTRLFLVRVGFGVALAITLLTSTFQVEFLPGDLAQRASDYLDVLGWIVAVAAIAFGLKSWWLERKKPSKSETIDALMDVFKQGPPHMQYTKENVNRSAGEEPRDEDVA